MRDGLHARTAGVHGRTVTVVRNTGGLYLAERHAGTSRATRFAEPTPTARKALTVSARVDTAFDDGHVLMGARTVRDEERGVCHGKTLYTRRSGRADARLL